MSLNEPSVDFHTRMLEASFRIPHESIKRNLKTVQKLDEKQFKKTDELVKELQKCKTEKEKQQKLKQMITSLKQYEKKMKARVEAENELMARIQARIDKLKELKGLKESEMDDVKKSDQGIHHNKLMKWYRDQTNLLIVDYLLKNVHQTDKNPGLLLLKNLGFEKLVDYDIILISNKISTSILNKDLTELISWINENKSYLRKIRSSLEFETRFQQYIEYVKDGKIPEALKLFTEHLVPFTASNFDDIKIASGMPVFVPKILQSTSNTDKYSRYSHLLSQDRYKDLSDLFLKIFYKIHGIPEDDPLLVYLSIGISSLKTRSCTCSKKEQPMDFETILAQKLNTTQGEQVQNTACPVCALEFQQLSETLPYSHNVRSHLFDNPVMLPNGNIFDKNKLLEFSKVNCPEGSIMDPITSEVFASNTMVTMYPT